MAWNVKDKETFMMDNKTCSVDILGVSLGEEGYLIIPRQTRELLSRW